ncbi:hypothetical protein AGOR_G00138750 [Albula goreensis]|uniref:Uncharacterized protein n=1 Tax=Albula goreensis TaxID=1534307 RepID=A0A8T3DBJ2_9TELE|nr:hypothetical protein AGOR_G00138750 [Albula goreensis]
MKYDLGFAKGLVMIFMLNCVAAVEVIQHGDITLKEVAQSGSPQADDRTPQLEAWTVKSCSTGLDCSTFLRTQIRVSTKAKTVKIQCFEQSTSTDTAKSLNLKKIRNMTRTDPRHNLRTVWEIIYDCIEADPGQTVLVTVTADYKRSESQKSVCRYQMEDGEVFTRVPNFNVTVDGQSRSLTVSVPEGPNVKTRLCYKQTNECAELNPPVFHIINTTHSLSADLSFPYQLPCVCVEVYFTGPDAV